MKIASPPVKLMYLAYFIANLVPKVPIEPNLKDLHVHQHPEQQE